MKMCLERRIVCLRRRIVSLGRRNCGLSGQGAAADGCGKHQMAVAHMCCQTPCIADRLRVGWLNSWEGFRESRRCAGDTYPESYVTENALVCEGKQL